MTKSKLVFIIILVIAIGIQFIELEKSNPPVQADIQSPMQIKTILTKSCYDCHSNETKWPWYSKVAPISWLVINDVEDGRKQLNFSDWEKLTTEKQAKLAAEITDEITSGGMPLGAYTVMHPGSSLDIEKTQELRKWFQQFNR